ncbi:hypothetical protein ACQPW3_20425 [Actinosynnema sp. CA-248983]
MHQREPDDEPGRRAARKRLLVFPVAIVLIFVAWGYLIGSMLGLWPASDWMMVLAGVVSLIFLVFARRSAM